MDSAAISGHGLALPAAMSQQGLWDGFFAEHYLGSRRAAAVWRSSGVEMRQGVADPRDVDVSGWGTAARMRRFVTEATPLGKAALSDCLDDAAWRPEVVDQLVVVSCTGYATPGLDILLARDLGLRPDVQRLCVGHMGCYAALPALAVAAGAARARGLRSLVLCLELTSLHLQPACDDVEQMVAHALFSDAAAAVAVEPPRDRQPSLRVVDVACHTEPAHAELMRWDVTDLGFRMGLSPAVPRVLRAHVSELVARLLAANDVPREAVAGWAIHPGGPRILDVAGHQLGLDERDLAESRAVLREHGNCSSATVLLVLQRILRQRDFGSGDAVVALAFGPGLTLYAALLRVA